MRRNGEKVGSVERRKIAIADYFPKRSKENWI